mmetsp:Transcript_9440/g.21293  ORF Transcript_9440/g.21293 Transcript_9440/m.21293 type:complete len:135 (-) Transcript_9440:751-1155(-)
MLLISRRLPGTECLDFVRQHLGPHSVAWYKALPTAAHRADLWRYLVLYVRGGIYLDIKTVLRAPLSQCFPRRFYADGKPTLFSVHSGMLGRDHLGSIHQGVLAATPGNPLLETLITHIISVPSHLLRRSYFCEV